MKNNIFVEGKNDIEFIKSLISDVTVKDIFIDSFKGGGAFDNSIITKRLKTFLNDFQIRPSEKLGIILDLDSSTREEKLAFLNISIKEVFNTTIGEIGVFKKVIIHEAPLEIACFFIEPNLDVLLRSIANSNSNISDCLFSCLNIESIKAKERDKAWVYYYSLWDICDVKERENREKNVNFEKSVLKNAWKLDSPYLKTILSFLENFKK
jgi:hypothetical protein